MAVLRNRSELIKLVQAFGIRRIRSMTCLPIWLQMQLLGLSEERMWAGQVGLFQNLTPLGHKSLAQRSCPVLVDVYVLEGTWANLWVYVPYTLLGLQVFSLTIRQSTICNSSRKLKHRGVYHLIHNYWPDDIVPSLPSFSAQNLY